MPTLEQIQSKLKKLQAQADVLIARKAQVAVDQIRDLMLKHGLTTADIEAKAKARRAARGLNGHAAGGKAKAAGAGKSVPKYRDHKTGATWTGHGRAPAWIAEAKDRNKFLIPGAAEANVSTASPESNAKAVSKKASKTTKAATGKGESKGLQPAKYLDPRTGATWSGRGRAPAWISAAGDRLKFLIDAPDAVSAGPTTTSEPKAAARKLTARKPAAKKTVTKKVATQTATAAKKPVSSEKPAVQKVPAAGKKVVAKKSATLQLKKPVARKLAAKKTPAVDVVATSAEAAAVPDAATELNA